MLLGLVREKGTLSMVMVLRMGSREQEVVNNTMIYTMTTKNIKELA